MENLNNSFTVVIVEDSPSYRGHIATELENIPGINVNVLVASTKSAGYDLFLHYPKIDLLIIDLDLDETLKGTNLENRLGVALMKDIRLTNQTVGMIACTGDHTEEARKLCKEQNAAYVRKYSLIDPPRLLFSTIYEYLMGEKT